MPSGSVYAPLIEDDNPGLANEIRDWTGDKL
jgi:hypothetical protein